MTSVELAERPPTRATVAAIMLNPALVASVLASAAVGYRREAHEDLPWPLSFLVAPLVLHRGTREALPSRISTHLPTWVSRQPSIRVGFPLRAASLVSPVREGLRFGIRVGLIGLADGRLRSTSSRSEPSDPALMEIIRSSTFVGRWFSRLDQPATAFALFGVTV